MDSSAYNIYVGAVRNEVAPESRDRCYCYCVKLSLNHRVWSSNSDRLSPHSLGLVPSDDDQLVILGSISDGMSCAYAPLFVNGNSAHLAIEKSSSPQSLVAGLRQLRFSKCYSGFDEFGAGKPGFGAKVVIHDSLAGGMRCAFLRSSHVIHDSLTGGMRCAFLSSSHVIHDSLAGCMRCAFLWSSQPRFTQLWTIVTCSLRQATVRQP
jgi:hypothetical protein